MRRDRADLSARINARVREMIAAGLVDEVRGLQRGADGLSPQAAAAVGYAELIEHLTGRCALTDAIEQIKIHTRRLAKHQRTWFRRLPGVRWMDVPAGADAAALVEPALAALCGE
ncbi:MAG: tRNA dimethylallyltransferase [Phycisphaerae bacterium]